MRTSPDSFCTSIISTIRSICFINSSIQSSFQPQTRHLKPNTRDG